MLRPRSDLDHSPDEVLTSSVTLPDSASRSRGWGALAAVVGTLTIVWGYVLPEVANWPGVKAGIARQEELNIDPAATFYSDQPALKAMLVTLQSTQRRHRSSWWIPSLWNDQHRQPD